MKYFLASLVLLVACDPSKLPQPPVESTVTPTPESKPSTPVPTQQPTEKPTASPTKSPTTAPTVKPTPKPIFQLLTPEKIVVNVPFTVVLCGPNSFEIVYLATTPKASYRMKWDAQEKCFKSTPVYGVVGKYSLRAHVGDTTLAQKEISVVWQ